MKKRMLNLLIIVILGVSVLISGCVSKEENIVKEKDDSQKIVIGTSGGYRPYTFVNDKGELTGFDVEVWKEIGRRIDKKIEFKTSAFSGLFGMLDINKLNTIANQITITKERKKKYLFTEPYVYYGAQLVVKKGNNTISSLKDLKGKKVGVSLGSNYEQIIREFDKNNKIEVVTYEDFQGSLQDVSLGRIDAVLNDRLAGIIAIEESGLNLQLGGKPVKLMKNAFPFVKNNKNKNLINEINKVIAEMKKDGTLTEISLKWFPVDITKNFNKE
ncbi:MAG: amino acid ABC transporter substrate-binding protein [Firmicutes bacterium]|nr:amino acid ABC transporter substrate-binding protein [Bacillota bacterium]